MITASISTGKGTVQRVSADNGVAEGRYVAASIGVTLVLAALLLPHHQANSHGHALAHDQIALSALPPTLHVTIAELKLAHEEIRDWRQDKLDFTPPSKQAWPSVAELSEALIPPFARFELISAAATPASAWQQQQHWYFTEFGQQSLVLSSEQVQPQIWYCPQPQTSFNPQHLRQHCQQVISGTAFKEH